MILEAKKPWEIILLFSVNIESKDKSITYLANDPFTEIVYQLDTSNNNDDLDLLNSISSLMANEEFKKYNHNFILVMDNHLHLKTDIENIIQPYGGTVIFDKHCLKENLSPIVKMTVNRINN